MDFERPEMICSDRDTRGECPDIDALHSRVSNGIAWRGIAGVRSLADIARVVEQGVRGSNSLFARIAFNRLTTSVSSVVNSAFLDLPLRQSNRVRLGRRPSLALCPGTILGFCSR